MQVFTKAALILFLSAISTILTLFYKPFVFKELNDIEIYSNLSIMITIFSGALYVQDIINDNLKAFLFFGILFVNLTFGIYWVISCFGLFFYNHFSVFYKFFPKFTKNFVAVNEAFDKTKFELNLFKYTSNLLSSTKIIAKEYGDRLSATGTSFAKPLTTKVQKLKSVVMRNSLDEVP